MYCRHISFNFGQYLPYCDSKCSYIHTRSVLLVQWGGTAIREAASHWEGNEWLTGSQKTPPPCPEAVARSCFPEPPSQEGCGSPLQAWPPSSGGLGGEWHQSAAPGDSHCGCWGQMWICQERNTGRLSDKQSVRQHSEHRAERCFRIIAVWH